MKKGWLCRTSCDEKNHEIAPVVMIQIEWWSKSSDDDLDREMIQIQWRWLEDSICRWRDDPVDTKKKTSADKLCQENTFLVKRECWCICNFGMYSSMYLMYCNPMFIPGCFYYVFESCCHASMFRSGGSLMWKSCQVIVGNPPIGQGLKSPQLWGPRVIRLS